MAQFKSQSYPKLAKAILAVFALAAAFGPSIMRSADRKTRSHITAISGRAQPKSDEEQKVKAGEDAAIAEEETKGEEDAKLREEDALVERLAERFFSKLKAEEARLERKLRIEEEKLEKQLREKERRAEKELARQLAEEERRTRKEIEIKLNEKLEESQRKMIERLEAEERAMAIALQEKIAEEKRLAQEDLQARLRKEEESGIQKIQNQLKEREQETQEKLEAKLVAEERAAQRKIEKEIAAKARAARKELKKRLDERERLAKAELLAQAEQEMRAALEELESKIRGEELAKRAALQATLAQEERQALAEINRRLEKEKAKRLGDDESIENRNARNVAKKSSKQTGKSDQQEFPKTGSDQNDEYKRPSLWTSIRHAPRQLVAGMGSFSLPTKEAYPGYLAFRAPPPLRFSDDLSLAKRPPAQALPEFSILAPGRGSPMVETRLSEEEARTLALMNQIVVELEPHTIVSGSIDTSIPREIDEAERLLIEQSDDPVVRPEEVLIFFENGGDGDNTRTIVPFSPALPSQKPPTRSGATYNRN